MIQKKKFSDAIAANISVVGGLLPDASLSNRGLIPAGRIQYSFSLVGSDVNNIVKIKIPKSSSPVSIIMSFGHPSSGSVLLAINMGVTSGSLDFQGKALDLYVSNLAGKGKIISAIAYYSPTDKTNIIEITCENLNYGECSVLGTSNPLESVTKIGISEYSDSIHTNYVVGRVKNW